MSPTRRDIIAGVTVPFAAHLAPLLRKVPADATLLALRGPYERTLAAFDEVNLWHTRIEDAFFAYLSEHPDAPREEAARATGLDEAEAAQKAASSANLCVVEEIAATPARTLAGLHFKAEVSRREDHNVPELLVSLAEDCENL